MPEIPIHISADKLDTHNIMGEEMASMEAPIIMKI